MKEYKIVKQKSELFKINDANLESDLNQLAREGWRVVSAAIPSHSQLFKVILERDKNR